MVRRRLADLYQVGKEVVLDDGHGAVTVWLQKVNTVEQEDAFKKANAMRSRLSREGRDKTSDYYLSIAGQTDDMNDEDLIEFLVAEEVEKRRPVALSAVEYRPEWHDDDYLEGLVEAWEQTHAAAIEADPEDEEALKVQHELERFNAEVEAEVEKLRDDARAMISDYSSEKLHDLVGARLIKIDQDLAWMGEFRKIELLHSVREPHDHKKKYFANRSELESVSREVLVQLLEEYASLSVDPDEGKELPPEADSSQQSTSPDKAEPEVPSGPEAVPA